MKVFLLLKINFVRVLVSFVFFIFVGLIKKKIFLGLEEIVFLGFIVKLILVLIKILVIVLIVLFWLMIFEFS